jgi:hypothetical protein
MIHIGTLDLEKKTAGVAVILEKPLDTSKKAAEMGAISWKSGWICWESDIRR